MKSVRRGAALLGAIAVLMAPALIARADVKVSVYSGFSDTGGGAPFSNLAGTFNSPNIAFAANSGYAWHPYGLGSFGARITGVLDVGIDGTYDFSLNSDDGSQLFIDGALAVDNGGPHGPTVVTSPNFLSAGVHPFQLDFFEDYGGPSGVDLYLPDGVRYGRQDTSVPEPGALSLLGGGLAGLGGLLLRRRLRG